MKELMYSDGTQTIRMKRSTRISVPHPSSSVSPPWIHITPPGRADHGAEEAEICRSWVLQQGHPESNKQLVLLFPASWCILPSGTGGCRCTSTGTSQPDRQEEAELPAGWSNMRLLLCVFFFFFPFAADKLKIKIQLWEGKDIWWTLRGQSLRCCAGVSTGLVWTSHPADAPGHNLLQSLALEYCREADFAAAVGWFCKQKVC